MSLPKRVILRIPENEMDYQNPNEWVYFYFSKFPSDVPPDSTRYFVHYQPPNVIPQPNPKVHIVIDLETQDFSGTLDEDFPHEIYAARRETNGMTLYAYSERVKPNLLRKVREYSDKCYPWGRSNREAGSR